MIVIFCFCAAGGVEVVVGQLGVSTLLALQGLELMVELHGSQVWDALLALSGAAFAPPAQAELCLSTHPPSVVYLLD